MKKILSTAFLAAFATSTLADYSKRAEQWYEDYTNAKKGAVFTVDVLDSGKIAQIKSFALHEILEPSLFVYVPQGDTFTWVEASPDYQVMVNAREARRNAKIADLLSEMPFLKGGTFRRLRVSSKAADVATQYTSIELCSPKGSLCEVIDPELADLTILDGLDHTPIEPNKETPTMIAKDTTQKITRLGNTSFSGIPVPGPTGWICVIATDPSGTRNTVTKTSNGETFEVGGAGSKAYISTYLASVSLQCGQPRWVTNRYVCDLPMPNFTVRTPKTSQTAPSTAWKFACASGQRASTPGSVYAASGCVTKKNAAVTFNYTSDFSPRFTPADAYLREQNLRMSTYCVAKQNFGCTFCGPGD